MKHVPFQSIYRNDFEVVEERDGKFTRYPHESQLPILLRALNLEFYGGLPSRVAIVQQITESTRRGPLHRFRFYGGESFSPKICLKGKGVVIADSNSHYG
ncbi:MAG: hypothetical protein EXS31_18725 [Pedosphaera sp.]|nr:hypothetical protein [Pedosphaera sp.]